MCLQRRSLDTTKAQIRGTKKAADLKKKLAPNHIWKVWICTFTPLSDDHVVEPRTEEKNREILTCFNHITLRQYPMKWYSALLLLGNWDETAADAGRLKRCANTAFQIWQTDNEGVWTSQNMVLQSHSGQRNLPSTDAGTRPHSPAKMPCVCRVLSSFCPHEVWVLAWACSALKYVKIK